MTPTHRFAALTLAVALLGSSAPPVRGDRAVGSIAASSWPYFPGSVIRIGVDGFPGPLGTSIVGAGTIEGGLYTIPFDAQAGDVTLAAGNAFGLARRDLTVVAPPDAARDAIVVASYDDGLAFHDAHSFAAIGMLGIAGAPSDVVFDDAGRLVAADTQGTALVLAPLSPWRPALVDGVPFADEVAVDERTGNAFATNRDIGGSGALTRVDASGSVSRVNTGVTAEGLAIDERRGIVYVANVNDDTVAAVDEATMRVRERFHAVARVFSLALSPDGGMLYAVSNQSAASPFAAAGSVVAIALRPRPHVVVRSADLTFPIGIALDAARGRLYVTDEERDAVYVLDARTLRPLRAPVATCRTPWKPLLDTADDRLYVPCARADEVDVFDVRDFHHASGAPFATGGYPLAVAVWHSRASAKHRTP